MIVHLALWGRQFPHPHPIAPSMDLVPALSRMRFLGKAISNLFVQGWILVYFACCPSLKTC